MIGDFLHLLAMLMLVLKILANKNVIGTFLHNPRPLLQNAIIIFSSLPGEVHRPHFRLEKFLSLPHENCFHRSHCIYYVFDEAQKTLQSKLR